MKLYSDKLFTHSQVRVGCKGKPIVVTKIRTMKRGAQQEYYKDHTISDALKNKPDNRVTWFGRFLRKSKIDEVPQLMNLFRGELRLISWRPVLRKEVRHFPSDIKKIYLELGPGLFSVFYSLPKARRTRETTFAEYRAFYKLYKKSPSRAYAKYGAKILANWFR